MRPVKKGDRGSAVEDIQRRLLALEYDIGPTGVDGVFLGATLAAVRDFQASAGVVEDGIVGHETWSALVDSTFTLGDRLLYLRFPYLHGRDVRTLQRVLNTLGFACGVADGIFGAFTERAVREFQHNVGHGSDGIVGAETVRAIMHLRHVWEGREADAPVSCSVAPARAAQVLANTSISLAWHDPVGREVAERLANLALASQPDARVSLHSGADDLPDADVVVLFASEGPDPDAAIGADKPVTVCAGADEGLAARIVTALGAGRGGASAVHVDLADVAQAGERALQSVAVGILDGLCASLSG